MVRIAVTNCSKIADYQESIRKAGGEPVVVDPSHDAPADIVRTFDGVVLTGGGDVQPELYQEPVHPTFTAAELGRDQFEIALAREAAANDLPLFAICRGIQVLNVARGGTLIQDIPSEIAGAGTHKISEPAEANAHDITITKGSLLNGLMGAQTAAIDACPVNSRHHQSVKALGEGLVVTATAPDGVIEAVEDPSRHFFLGVQWHPESFWKTGEFAALFKGLVDAARQRRGGRI